MTDFSSTEPAPGFGSSPSCADEVRLLSERYELLSEIARGGMGIVLRGRDRTLRRDLAIKVLLDRYASRPDIAGRFLEEAQITGQLQHPGVVPIHELGTLADGRPFFAMKLVKGRTLGELLKERSARVRDADASGSPLELPRFLAIFHQVCQTLAYAHSKGVIHRDLKPANIMVGAFGEVQVMDWGLAKVLTDEPAGDSAALRPPLASVIETARSSSEGDSATQTGAVIGTLPYMPPEQARGETDRLDRRCDVFGLGAILCDILTGGPPYTGTTAEIRTQAQLGHVAPALARIEACGADAELIVLAKSCLQPRQEDRPKDAAAVSEALSTYLASVQERLRQAELDKSAAQVRAKEERKRRNLAALLAAALVGLLALGGGAGLLLHRRLAERDQDVEAALGQAGAFREQARWDDAWRAWQRAEARLGPTGPEELLRRLAQDKSDLELAEALDQIPLRRAIWRRGGFDYASADREYEKAFRAAGLARVEEDAGPVAARVRVSAIRAQLVAALDDWASTAQDRSRRAWLLAVAQQADSDPGGNRFRDPRVWEDPEALRRLAAEADVEKLSPQVLVALAGRLQSHTEDALPLLRRAQAAHPGDFWLNFKVAHALADSREFGEAIGFYWAALVARPRTFAAYINLGNALFEKGRLDQAMACFQKAIEIDSKVAGPHNNLAFTLHHKGKLDEAIACFKKALAIDPKLAEAHTNLGNVLMDKGDLEGALAAHRKALECDPKLAEAHTNLGIALKAQGKPDEAIDCYRKAIALDPKDFKPHTNLGNALRDKGQLDEAIECHKKALAIDPKNGRTHTNLGNVLMDKRKLDEAIDCYRKALELDPKLAKPHHNLGNALYEKGKLEEAIPCFRQAIAMDPEYAEAHCNLGHLLREQGKFAAALASLKRGHELGSERNDWRYPSAQWVRACEQLLRLDEQLPAVLEGRSKPADAAEKLAFADLCRQYKQRHAAAARLYADAFAEQPKLADDLSHRHRYNAACAAVLAAAGRGEDAGDLDNEERARLRSQALAWLRADLAAYAGLAQGSAQARVWRQLQHWLKDADLATVRDEAELAKLPEADPKEWNKLWAEVAALLTKARSDGSFPAPLPDSK